MDNQQAIDYSYLGAVIDTDGSLYLLHQKIRGGKGYYKPGISFVNTNPVFLKEIDRLLTLYRLPHYVGKPRHNENGFNKKKKVGMISVLGWKRVGRVLPALLPFIRAKKYQAELLLELVEQRIEKGHAPYDAEDMRLIHKVREMNS